MGLDKLRAFRSALIALERVAEAEDNVVLRDAIEAGGIRVTVIDGDTGEPATGETSDRWHDRVEHLAAAFGWTEGPESGFIETV